MFAYWYGLLERKEERKKEKKKKRKNEEKVSQKEDMTGRNMDKNCSKTVKICNHSLKAEMLG